MVARLCGCTSAGLSTCTSYASPCAVYTAAYCPHTGAPPAAAAKAVPGSGHAHPLHIVLLLRERWFLLGLCVCGGECKLMCQRVRLRICAHNYDAQTLLPRLCTRHPLAPADRASTPPVAAVFGLPSRRARQLGRCLWHP